MFPDASDYATMTDLRGLQGQGTSKSAVRRRKKRELREQNDKKIAVKEERHEEPTVPENKTTTIVKSEVSADDGKLFRPLSPSSLLSAYWMATEHEYRTCDYYKVHSLVANDINQESS